jgi:hypothetical protein
MSHETVSTTPMHEGANVVQADVNLTERFVHLSPEDTRLERDKRSQRYHKAAAEAQAEAGLPPTKIHGVDAAHEVAHAYNAVHDLEKQADHQDDAAVRWAGVGRDEIARSVDDINVQTREKALKANKVALEVEAQQRAELARQTVASIPEQRTAPAAETIEKASVSP